MFVHPAAVMHKGFTLIELLVVVGIVIALACLILPVIQMARCAATTTACANNMHQVGLAYIAYAADWKGRYPADSRLTSSVSAQSSDAWYDRLPDYLDVKKATMVLRCAGQQIHPTPTMFANASPKSFKMNDWLDRQNRPRYLIVNRMRDASEVLLLIDGVCSVSGMGQWSRAVPLGVSDSRHPGYVNALACDGATLLRRAAPADWELAYRWLSLNW